MSSEIKQLKKDKERLTGEVTQLQEQQLELQEQVRLVTFHYSSGRRIISSHCIMVVCNMLGGI